AALQLNYFLVMRALDNKLINTQVANAMNRILRSCEANLRHGPLIPANQQDTVTTLTLTPEGEEIAPTQQIPEEANEEVSQEVPTEVSEKASEAEKPALQQVGEPTNHPVSEEAKEPAVTSQISDTEAPKSQAAPQPTGVLPAEKQRIQSMFGSQNPPQDAASLPRKLAAL
ncbi:MAG: hypothetical protein WAM66_06995, partial [Acidobacteriaceae bacterium]